MHGLVCPCVRGGSELGLKVAFAPRTAKKTANIPFEETKLTLRYLLNASAYGEQSSPPRDILLRIRRRAEPRQVLHELRLKSSRDRYTERYYRLNVKERTKRFETFHGSVKSVERLRGNCFGEQKCGRRFRQHLYTVLSRFTMPLATTIRPHTRSKPRQV